MSATERRTQPDRLLMELLRGGGAVSSEIKQGTEHLYKEFAAAARAGARRLTLEREIRQASRRRHASAPVPWDLVCSVAGRVLAWAEYMAPIVAPAPAIRGGASAGSRLHGGPAELWLRPLRGADIQIGWLWEDGAPWLEFNLIKPCGGAEIRPFIVEVRAPEGHQLQAPIQVLPGMLPPLFPSPTPGIYCFLVRWDGGAGEMTLELRPEDDPRYGEATRPDLSCRQGGAA